MKMTLRKIFGLFTILCLLALTGAFNPAYAAQEISQSIPGIETIDPVAVRLAIGDKLEYEIPVDTMVIMGRYNVTIDPAENTTIRPFNLNTPIEARGCTPIGALDAVARSGELNYTTYYYTSSDRLVIDSIDEYGYEEDKTWYVLSYLNETHHMTDRDVRAHNLTDGETFWLIYCDLSDYDSRYESRTDRAIAGLSITVTYGEGGVIPPAPPFGIPPVPVAPPAGVTQGPTVNVTPIPPSGIPPMPIIPPGVVMPGPTASVAPQGEGPYTAFASSNTVFGILSPGYLTDSNVAALPAFTGGAQA